jgi:hypothetical protein
MARGLAENLAPEAQELLQPVGYIGPDFSARAYDAYQFRDERLSETPGIRGIQRVVTERRGGPDMPPFMAPNEIEATYAGTQDPALENHRRHTPPLQEMVYAPDTREQLLDGIDQAAIADTDRLFKLTKAQDGQLFYDVLIVGSGPHAEAAATRLREESPDLNILMVDENPLGGLWRSTGPLPAWLMNSRVRKASRTQLPIPRTPGNINPLGEFAPMQLSDTVKGNYADNTEMGTSVAINDHLSVNDAMVGVRAGAAKDYGDYATTIIADNNGRIAKVVSGVTLFATGRSQESTVAIPDDLGKPYYYDTAKVYGHFGNANLSTAHRPLQKFAGKTILAVGGGDSALTSMEALIGKLPPETYGPYGVGRDRVGSIIWVGAPAQYAREIQGCLRGRYVDGIVQALPRDSTDRGAVIDPRMDRVRGVDPYGNGVRAYLESGEVVRGDYLFDNTNRKLRNYGPKIQYFGRAAYGPTDQATRKIGTASTEPLPERTQRIISYLGIGENIVSLWATIGRTERDASNARYVALSNRPTVARLRAEALERAQQRRAAGSFSGRLLAKARSSFVLD